MNQRDRFSAYDLRDRPASDSAMPISHILLEENRVMEAMDAHGADRRVHRRLQLRLPVELRRLQGADDLSIHAHTNNVSTGGLYFETDRPTFSVGDRLSVDLSLPASSGVSSTPGRANGTMEVLRVVRLTHVDADMTRFGIAAAFTDRLRFLF